MKNKRFYFDKKLITFFAVYMVLITFILSIIFNALYVKERESQLAIKGNKVIKMSSEVGNFLVESIDMVKMAAYTVNSLLEEGAADQEILEYFEDQTRAYQKTVSSEFNGVYGIIRGVYLDGSGWTPPEGYVVSERPWYVAAVENGGNVTLVTPYVDAQTNAVILSVCKLLPDRENVVSIDVAMNEIQQIVEKSMADAEWVQSMILDAHGVVVAHSNTAEIGKNWMEEEDGFGKLIITELDENPDECFSIEWQGTEYFVFSDKVMGGWKAVTVMNASEMLAPLDRISRLFFVVLFLILCTLGALYVGISRLREREWSLKQQVKVMADACDEVWLIRLPDNKILISDAVTGAVEGSTSWKDNAQYELRSFMDGITDERFKKGAFAFIELSTLPRRLQGRSSLYMEFLDVNNRNCHLKFVPANWNEDGELVDVLWLLEIDEEREERPE